MPRAAIIGAAGYAGAELTRLLLGHPEFELVRVTSSADEGRLVHDLYPGLADCTLAYTAHDASAIAHEAEIVFLAVPHTAAMAAAPELLRAGLTVVDCSADFRFRDPDLFTAWYAEPHTAPELRAVTATAPDAVFMLNMVRNGSISSHQAAPTTISEAANNITEVRRIHSHAAMALPEIGARFRLKRYNNSCRAPRWHTHPHQVAPKNHARTIVAKSHNMEGCKKFPVVNASIPC